MALVPPWTHIYRVQRDIPISLVSSGVENGNLRELALARMKDFGTACRDVRTREVGIQEVHHKVSPNQFELIRRDYHANEGWETFPSYEDPKQDILIGLLRLRKASKKYTFREEFTSQPTSIVRELHYGSVKRPKKFQHQGFGTLLMEEAERNAREEHGTKKISVISGVGVRNYYAKLGYELWVESNPSLEFISDGCLELRQKIETKPFLNSCTSMSSINTVENVEAELRKISTSVILSVQKILQVFSCLPRDKSLSNGSIDVSLVRDDNLIIQGLTSKSKKWNIHWISDCAPRVFQ